MEPVNDDAKSIESKISFENKNVKEVVNNLIVAANDSGFVKADAKIDIKVTEIIDETIVASEILDSVKTSVTQKLTELEIAVEVTTVVEIETQEPTQSEDADTSSKEDTTSQQTPSTNEPQDTKPETTACKHTSTSAKAVSTGSNIIDNSKLDVVNHAKVCKDCGEQVSLEKHNVANGKCTVCGQSNFATTKVTADTAGIAGGPSGHNGVEINSDGTPDYDFMVQEGYYAIGFDTLQQYLDEEEWVYKIPESVFLTALKTKFVVDDSLFAKIKAQGKYRFFWSDHSYSNGVFYIAYIAAGDVSEYTHDILGYCIQKFVKSTLELAPCRRMSLSAVFCDCVLVC